MNSAVTRRDGLLSRRIIIMILVKDHKTTSQAGARKQRQPGRQHEGDLRLPSPSCCGAPTPHTHTGKQAGTAGLECAVPGHWDCGEPAAALERRQTSLLSWTLFFSRSLKGLRSGDMCGTAPGTGAEQVPRGGENPPSVYLLKALSIALPDSSWQGSDHVSGRLQGI